MRVLDYETIQLLVKELEKEWLSIPDIMQVCGISQRTAYRWLDEIERWGRFVARRKHPDGGFMFKIMQ